MPITYTFSRQNNEIVFTVVTRLYYWNTLLTKVWNHWNVYVHRSLVAYRLASDSRLMQRRSELSAFCTSFKTTGLLFFIPGNGDSRERCVPLGIILLDCNLRSGSSSPALHTGKNTPGITGGCGQTKNVTEPAVTIPRPNSGHPRKPWIKREVFIEGCQTVAGSMHSIGIIGAPAKTGPSAEK